MGLLSRTELARRIDHTLLRPDATPADVERVCREALEWRFAAVVVNPLYLPQVARFLAGSPIAPCAVIDFPLGAGTREDRRTQAEHALAAGARELDVVQPVGLLKAGLDDLVLEQLGAVVEPARRAGALVKVILETALLTPEETVRSCRLAVEVGAHFVKTSTGFGVPGATEEVVSRIRAAVGPRIGVKAAGGIRDYASACRMLVAGADRIGTSRGVEVVRGAPEP
ncbi:MAG: deoxyribose-phosphate aldolase [Armatimonadetes bacterium]|nr:deoxyribose-phosphate aldolase [Armatimonadota bacterium]MDW8153680.1 deoxyribose-phosphate aldolase [Armatimonadota bacterium]